MEQPMEFDSFDEFKEKFKIFAHISDIILKKDFSENPVNLDMGI